MGKVIFVNGTARCGSTMVDLIMGNDPGGFSLGEVCSWYRPTRTHHFDIKCGCGVYPCPMWQRLRETSERDLYDELLGQRFGSGQCAFATTLPDQAGLRAKEAGDAA